MGDERADFLIAQGFRVERAARQVGPCEQCLWTPLPRSKRTKGRWHVVEPGKDLTVTICDGHLTMLFEIRKEKLSKTRCGCGSRPVLGSLCVDCAATALCDHLGTRTDDWHQRLALALQEIANG